MKVAIVGSRKYRPLAWVWYYVASLADDDIVISGGAPGPDAEAEKAAKARGLAFEPYYIDKTGLPPFGTPEAKAEFTRRAYARNTLIAQACDRMVAFWDGKSGGTKHAMDEARKLGKPVDVRPVGWGPNEPPL